jgi:hypothetical protein
MENVKLIRIREHIASVTRISRAGQYLAKILLTL